MGARKKTSKKPLVKTRDVKKLASRYDSKSEKGKTTTSSTKPQYIPLGFKYQPRSSQLKAVPADLATLIKKAQNTIAVPEEDDSSNANPLLTTLRERQLLNTSLPFSAFFNRIEPLTRSLPLVLHHRKEICFEIARVLDGPGRDLCASHLFDLIPAIIETIPSLPLLTEIFPPIIQSLVFIIVSNLHTSIIEKAVQTLAVIYAECGKQIVENPKEAWSQVRVPLGASPLSENLHSKTDITQNGSNNVEGDDYMQESLSIGSLDNDDNEDNEDNEENDNKDESSSEDESSSSDDDSSDTSRSDDDEAEKSSNTIAKRKQIAASKINSNQKRFLASAFSLLLRKAAWLGDSFLENLYSVILDDFLPDKNNDILSESLAIMISESSKGIGSHLHSLSSTIITTYLSHPNRHIPTLSRALISLLHYSRSEHLIPVVKSLLDYGDPVLLSVLAGVRKGQRVDASQRKSMYAVASKAQDPSACCVLALHLLSFAKFEELVAQNRQDQKDIGNGVDMINILRKAVPRQDFYTLIRTLSKRNWTWFKDFLLKPALEIIDEDKSDEAISLLAMLASNDQLTMDANRLDWLDSKIDHELKSWTADSDEDKTIRVINLIRISPWSKASHKDVLQHLLETIVDIPVQKITDSFKSSPANPVAISCEILGVLPDTPDTSIVKRIVDKLYWNSMLMSRISKMELPEDILEDPLLDNILSHDSTLRGSTLCLHANGIIKGGCSKIVKIAAEADSFPLTFQNERQRRASIRKLANTAKTLESDSFELKIAICYLIAMLKLNYKPVWSESIEALSELIHKFQSDFWKIAEPLLRFCVSKDDKVDAMIVPSWIEDYPLASSQTGDNNDRRLNMPFTTSEWRCFKLNELVAEKKTCEKWIDMQLEVFALSQKTNSHLDLDNFQRQILILLSKSPAVLQAHSRQIVPVFMDDFGKNYASVDWTAGGKRDRARLEAWLSVFASATNAGSLYETNVLKELHFRYLTVGDQTIQRLALECILTYKSSILKNRKDILFDLIDPKSFKDAIINITPILNGLEASSKDQEQLVPIILRLLYGITITRSNHQASNRKSILSVLRSCSTSYLGTFVDIMIAPFNIDKILARSDHDDFHLGFSIRRQLGFLSLSGEVIKYLGSLIAKHIPDLLNVSIAIATSATNSQNLNDTGGQHESVRKIRNLTFKRISEACNILEIQDLEPIVSNAFSSLISPRMENFTRETSQGASALLELFSVWSKDLKLAEFFVKYDSSIVGKVFECIQPSKSQKEVVTRVFDIAVNLLNLSAQENGSDAFIDKKIIEPNLSTLLKSLEVTLDRCHKTFNARADGVARLLITVLNTVVKRITESADANKFIALLLPLLERPTSRVPEDAKAEFLFIISQLTLKIDIDLPQSRSLVDHIYQSISGLFLMLSQRKSRQALTGVLGCLAVLLPSSEQFTRAYDFLRRLNSYSLKRPEDPDFDERLAAYGQLNETDFANLTAFEWKPLVYNMLFFVKDVEEMSLRNNASYSLCRFIQMASDKHGSGDNDFDSVLKEVLYPGLKANLKNKHDVVRGETLSILAELVRLCSGYFEDVRPLRVLLADGDKEASFFSNILHLQVHRRARALRRLSSEANSVMFSEEIIQDVLLPTVIHFILDEKVTDSSLINNTAECIGILCGKLSWKLYYKNLLRFYHLAEKSGPRQKILIRTTVSIMKHFHFMLDEEPDDDSDDEEDNGGMEAMKDSREGHQIYSTVYQKLVPRLMNFIDTRIENDESVRIPLTEGLAAILCFFPAHAKKRNISTLVMSLAQILRSKSQDVREEARGTLCNIIDIVGNEYLHLFVKELRGALSRGPQLCVLGFTVHALLLRVYEKQETANFDHAIADVVPILTEDLFGVPAQDRSSSELRAKTAFSEVRYCKSADSFRMVIEKVSPENIGHCLLPLREVLRRTDSEKTLKEMEELLVQIARGIQENRNLKENALLELCYSLISGDSNFLRPTNSVDVNSSKKVFDPSDHIVRASVHESKDAVDFFSKNKNKFVGLGLDLLLQACSKNRFDLEQKEIVSRMDPLVETVMKALSSTHTSVICRALRAVAILIRFPLHSVTSSSPRLLKRCLKMLYGIGSLDTELAQATLRALSVIIRTCKTASLTNTELVKLLQRISGDLDTPEVYHSVFGVIKAIVSRKFVIPEIYDLMERIAELLVTSPASDIRETCRSILLQFLLDYPQGQNRLKVSLEFLCKNLSYTHESGRISVMELLNAVFGKFSPEILNKYYETFFFSLLMVLANDDSTKCREMGSFLINSLLQRINSSCRQNAYNLLMSWGENRESAIALKRVAFQVLGENLTVISEDNQTQAVALRVINMCVPVIESSADRLRDAEEEDGKEEEEVKEVKEISDGTSDIEWDSVYRGLECFSQCLEHVPKARERISGQVWERVRILMLAPHSWIRKSCCRIVELLFMQNPADVNGKLTTTRMAEDDPISTFSLRETLVKLLHQLKSKNIDEALATLVVKNLLYIGNVFAGRVKTMTITTNGDGNNDGDGDNILEWYFERLRYQACKSIIHRPSIHDKAKNQWTLNPAGIINCMVQFAGTLTADEAEPVMMRLIEPIYRIIEMPEVDDEQTKELKNFAHLAYAKLQTHFSPTICSITYNKLGKKKRKAYEQNGVGGKRSKKM